MSSDEPLAVSPQSQPVSPSEAEYETIWSAFMETQRGRWFLAEYARRNRHADTTAILEAIGRVEGMIRTGAGSASQSADRFRAALTDMAEAISRTKADIAALRPEADQHGRIGLASEELDSIVDATARATSDILAAAEHIQEAAWTMREQGIDARFCDELDAKATDIYTACSFQDITGQRTHKIVQVLRYLDGRISALIDIWGTLAATTTADGIGQEAAAERWPTPAAVADSPRLDIAASDQGAATASAAISDIDVEALIFPDASGALFPACADAEGSESRTSNLADNLRAAMATADESFPDIGALAEPLVFMLDPAALAAAGLPDVAELVTPGGTAAPDALTVYIESTDDGLISVAAAAATPSVERPAPPEDRQAPAVAPDAPPEDATTFAADAETANDMPVSEQAEAMRDASEGAHAPEPVEAEATARVEPPASTETAPTRTAAQSADVSPIFADESQRTADEADSAVAPGMQARSSDTVEQPTDQAAIANPAADPASFAWLLGAELSPSDAAAGGPAGGAAAPDSVAPAEAGAAAADAAPAEAAHWQAEAPPDPDRRAPAPAAQLASLLNDVLPAAEPAEAAPSPAPHHAGLPDIDFGAAPSTPRREGTRGSAALLEPATVPPTAGADIPASVASLQFRWRQAETPAAQATEPDRATFPRQSSAPLGSASAGARHNRSNGGTAADGSETPAQAGNSAPSRNEAAIDPPGAKNRPQPAERSQRDPLAAITALTQEEKIALFG